MLTGGKVIPSSMRVIEGGVGQVYGGGGSPRWLVIDEEAEVAAAAAFGCGGGTQVALVDDGGVLQLEGETGEVRRSSLL
jgi:hypothetical protein